MNRQIMLTSILALGIAAPAFAASEVDPAGAITDQHLAIFDLDADGAVSRSEYRVTTSNVFILMDADSDNMLSPAEAEGIPGGAVRRHGHRRRRHGQPGRIRHADPRRFRRGRSGRKRPPELIDGARAADAPPAA